MSDATLTATLQLKDQMSGPLGGAIGKVGRLDDSFKQVEKSGVSAMGKLGNASERLGKSMSTIGNSVASFDSGITRAMGRMANMTQRLIGMTIAMDALGGKGGVMAAAA